MNGVLFELLSPLIINEFALDIPTYRTGFRIWLSLGIIGLYVWPWLADRFGRRRLLALNIAMDRKELVDGRVQHFLRVLGSDRFFRTLRRRLARRQDRSAHWLYHAVDLGCSLHNALGLCHEQHLAMGLWSRPGVWLFGV